jgi:trk system potassium uptake protein TrkH
MGYFNRLPRFLRRMFFYARTLNRLFNRVDVQDSIQLFLNFLVTLWSIGIPFLILTTFACLIYDVGYNEFYAPKVWFYSFWKWMYRLLFLLFSIRILVTFKAIRRWRARIFNFSLAALILYLIHLIDQILYFHTQSGENNFTLYKILLYAGTIFLFFVEGSHSLRGVYKKTINPALLFVGSFFILIMAGSFLLMLPNATTHGITPADAWFTSASAVCVTGLIVVDTATAFTTFGKVIIIALVQLGGLGVMTFAGLLAYLSTGSVSFANQMALKDMLSSSRMANVIGLVTRIIFVTLTFEAVGAILIYATLNDNFIINHADRFFFSAFHAVSAFCNAGFSTLTDGLYDTGIRQNYLLQITIALLIILGGLGFPIVFNVAMYLRIRIGNLLFKILKIPEKEYHANVLHTSSRLALTTTIILLATGFFVYGILETNASLKQHPTVIGKIVTSFFAAVTPRTAGFNTVDLTTLRLPTVLIYFVLMLIGASPGSTGGGIKTTVAAVAFLNMRSVILGRTRIEVFRTQISETSIHRSFAIILCSLLVLSFSILLVSFQDGDKGLIKIAFEVVSAFSTVGLSLGITNELSVFSKFVLSFVMLIGRVGTLTLLFALVSPLREVNYRYPTEDILL